MASEKSTQWLIDLLYEEEAAEPPPPEEALEPAQQEELRTTRDLLAQVRAELPSEQPPARMREAIFAEARAQAERASAAQAQPAEPGPAAGGGAEPTSLWGSPGTRRVFQAAAVLAVALGAGLLLTRTFEDTVESKFSAANDTVTQEVAFEGGAPSEPIARPDPAPAPPAEEVAAAEPPQDPSNDFPELADATGEPVDAEPEEPETTLALREDSPKQAESDDLRQSSGEERARGARAQEPSADRAPKTRRARRRASSRPPARSKKKSKAAPQAKDELMATLDDEARDSYGGAGSLEGLNRASKNAKADRDANANLFGGAEGPSRAPAEPAPRPSVDPAPAAPSKSADAVGNFVGADDAEERQQQAATASSGAEPEAEAEEEPTRGPTSLQSVESAYRRNDYTRTAQEASSYLDRGLGSNQERARALELKAESLERLGRGAEARQAWQQLERDHPSYYKKRNLRQKRKRRAKPKRRSVDEVEMFDQSF